MAVELIVPGLAGWAEGLGRRATARGFAGAPQTVLPWLVEAAEHLPALTSSWRGEDHVQQRHLDAWSAVRSAVKAGERRAEEASQRLSHSPQWVWSAIDPPSQLLLVRDGGPRPRARAQRVVHPGLQGRAPGGVP